MPDVISQDGLGSSEVTNKPHSVVLVCLQLTSCSHCGWQLNGWGRGCSSSHHNHSAWRSHHFECCLSPDSHQRASLSQFPLHPLQQVSPSQDESLSMRSATTHLSCLGEQVTHSSMDSWDDDSLHGNSDSVGIPLWELEGQKGAWWGGAVKKMKFWWGGDGGQEDRL